MLADRIIARLTISIQTLRANNDTRHATPDTRHPPPDTRHATPISRRPKKTLALLCACTLLAAANAFAQEKPAASTGVGTLARDVSVKEDGDPAVIPEVVVQSIRRGQEYLKKAQNAKGSFYGSDDTGPVSLVILALMVDGSVPGRGPYGREVARGVEYLLKNAQPSGLIHSKDGRTPPMYNHGLSTLCLAEVWGMTGQPDILPVLKRAVDLIVRCQNATAGGWNYSPAVTGAGNGRDISVTVMQVVALRAAQNAGIFVPEKTIRNAVLCIKGNHTGKEKGFGYYSPSGPAPARTAAGVLSLQMCGQYDAKETRLGLEYLEEHAAKMDKVEHYYYAQYYAMQCMYQARDSAKWNAWYEAQCRSMMSKQSKENGNIGGLYETAWAILAMGLPYRYLPIYQR
jgi:hypothetical protein